MKTNILKQIETIIADNPDWKLLYRKLRVNDETIELEDLDSLKLNLSSGFVHYKNLNQIERFENEIIWTAFTFLAREQVIEFQHKAVFDINGNFKGGIMSNFAFGVMEMDHAVINEYFHEIEEKFASTEYWDVISNNRALSIL